MKNVIGKLHSNGIPPGDCEQFAKLARLANKLGLTEMQSLCIAGLAHSAAAKYHWKIAGQASGLEIHTKLGN